jgi:hypothetical protein
VELNLRLELAGEPDQIRGVVVADDGRRSEFNGWLGLAAALGRLLSENGVEAADPESS